ncbi:MAG: hypothetical protein WBN83_03545 [Desulfoprunum sp.]|uniref:hypothetical protein n=1 Tax=Desulfoprunum sp. TaxID=2020866 RepID=UPI003C781D39
MRCPKCGFISFDQLPKCVKCGKSFSSIADLVHGTAFSVSAPLFLKIQEVTETKAFGDDIKISDEMAEEFEVQDPDLEILFENEEGETGAEPSALQMDAVDDTALKEEIESSLEFGKDEEEGEISIDLSQFQNDLEGPVLGGTVAALGSAGKINRELPDELSDISDLAPPPRETRSPATVEADDDFDFSLDLGMDNLGGGPSPAVSTSKVAQPAAENADDELDFSLDLGMDDLDDRPAPANRETPPAGDIDFGGLDSPSIGKTKGSGRKPVADDSDLDSDLDFDLDLGGLTLDKD